MGALTLGCDHCSVDISQSYSKCDEENVDA